jgi:hypothetical protein
MTAFLRDIGCLDELVGEVARLIGRHGRRADGGASPLGREILNRRCRRRRRACPGGV